MHQEVQIKESRWADATPKRWKQPKGEDRIEVKEARVLRCTLLNGSAWSTEKKYLKRYEEKCDIFFGIEQRLVRKKWRRSSTERPRKDGGSQLTQEESLVKGQAVTIESIRQEESFYAVDSNRGAVVGAEEGAIDSISGDEGRTAQA